MAAFTWIILYGIFLSLHIIGYKCEVTDDKKVGDSIPRIIVKTGINVNKLSVIEAENDVQTRSHLETKSKPETGSEPKVGINLPTKSDKSDMDELKDGKDGNSEDIEDELDISEIIDFKNESKSYTTSYIETTTQPITNPASDVNRESIGEHTSEQSNNPNTETDSELNSELNNEHNTDTALNSDRDIGDTNFADGLELDPEPKTLEPVIEIDSKTIVKENEIPVQEIPAQEAVPLPVEAEKYETPVQKIPTKEVEFLPVQVEKCPMGCRCTAGSSKHRRHHWHRLLAAYRTHRLVYGPGRGSFLPQRDPYAPQGRHMTCVGLPDMPDYLPTDVNKVTLLGSLSEAWEDQEKDIDPGVELDAADTTFNSDTPNRLRQITTLGKLNVIRSSSVRHLDLLGNRIKVLYPNDFDKLDHIKHLHLRNNRLKVISVGAFQGLLNVTDVDLSENHIKHLPKATFYSLHHIRKLNIAKNRIGQLHQRLFSDLKALNFLDISSNFLEDLPKDIFFKNRRLRTLHMGFNNLHNIRIQWFSDLPNLMKLDLAGNQIHRIEPETFANLNNLTAMNLDQNDIWELSSDMLEGLDSLLVLRLQRNNISFMENGIFQNKSELRELHLDYNQIDMLTDQSLVGLQDLRVLGLSHNALTGIHSDVFKPVRKLERLYLSYNKLKIVTNRNFYGLLKLLELRLDHNEIKTVEDSGFAVGIVPTFSSLTWLHLNFNQLGSIHRRMLQGMLYLKYLNIGHNNIQEIDPVGLATFNRLTTLIMNDNRIGNIESGTFKQLMHIRHINMAGNSINSMPFNMLLGLENLEDLNLNNNELTAIDTASFLDTPRLMSLSVRRNQLREIDLELLDTLYQLRSLDLTSNDISKVTLPDTARRTLHFLSLADNAMTTLPVNITEILSKRGSLHLYGNPWTCDCDIGWMITELPRINVVYLARPTDILCKSPAEFSGEKVRSLTAEEICPSTSSNLLQIQADDSSSQERKQRKKLDTGCSFSRLANRSRDNIKETKDEILPWVTNIFSSHTHDWLCTGIRLSRDHILTHTSCIKGHGQNQFKKVKVSFGSTSSLIPDGKDDLYTTHIKQIEFYQGSLDLSIIKINRIKQSKQIVFPCVLNTAGMSTAINRTTHAVVVAVARPSRDTDKVKLRAFSAHTVRSPCVTGYLCLIVNPVRYDPARYRERHLPVFFKVGRSRWALGALGNAKAYGNVLATPLDSAVDWIHKTLRS